LPVLNKVSTQRSALTAKSYGALLEPAKQFIRIEAGNGAIVVVAAEKIAADELTWAACETVLGGVYRHTPSQLALEVSRACLAAQGVSTAGALALEAIAALITNRARAQAALPYFGPVADRPRFARAVLRTITELRLELIASQQLRQFGGAPAELAVLLEEFEAQLAEREIADLATAMRTAVDVVSSGKHPYCGAAVLLLCPGLQYQAERELIKALVGGARAVLALSTEEEEAAQLGAIVQCSPEALRVAETSSVQRVQSRLFTFGSGAAVAPDESLEMFAAASEALECVEIARRVSRLAAEGLPFDRMAVLLRSTERYTPVLAEACDRARIPLWLAQGARRPHPAGRALLGLLHFANEGFPATRFVEYLSLGQAPPQRAISTGEIYAPAYWERLIVDAAVVGGVERWSRRLDGLARELESTGDNAAAEALASLRGFVLQLLEFLTRLPGTASWGVWLDKLADLAEYGVAKPDDLLHLLEELAPLSEIAGVTLQDVLLVLEARFRDYRSYGEERRHGCVYVGNVESARGMAFDVVFIPGLVEGTFPRRPAEDPLLLDEVRRDISRHLRCTDEFAEHKLLRAAVAAAERRIVGSYARMDLLTGRARVPSLYFFELASAATGGALDVRMLESEARSRVDTQAGWPAPRDPMQAIDEGEFDLAVLGPALVSPEGARGLGAYLTKVDAPVAEALRARWAKWDKDKWRQWDGYQEKFQHESPLSSFALDRHVYSASLLERFAACPYSFFLSAIEGLRPANRSEIVHRMPPDVRGRIFHAAAFRYVRAVIEDRLEELTTKLAAADAAVEAVALEFEEQIAPALPGVWRRGVESIRADLRSWIVEHEASASNWRPIAAELSFGKEVSGECDPASTPEVLDIAGLVKLSGSIDLIEATSSGLIRVIDHKTGKKHRYRTNLQGDRTYYDLRAVGSGEVLQPLLYGLAAEALMGKTAVSAQLSYSTMRGGLKEESVQINQRTRKDLNNVLLGIDDSIRQGWLPSAPRPGACMFCDYKPLCGPYEEERAARKAPIPELDALRVLD